jgi:ethanolaminephosphotransferase
MKKRSITNIAIAGVVAVLQNIQNLIKKLFDNLDGKQARKTGQSSPLGMIFDHGCDSFNTILNGMALSKLYGVSTQLQAITLVMVASTFYFATLEQYFTHKLYLPIINAVNEGQILVVCLTIFGGLSGKIKSTRRTSVA